MSVFGWSYPPGADNDPFAPYNQDWEDEMKKARLRFSWAPSVSPDVTTQRLTAALPGQPPFVDQLFGPETAEYVCSDSELVDGDVVVEWSILTTDATGQTADASASYQVPNVEPPAPATGLAAELAEIVDQG